MKDNAKNVSYLQREKSFLYLSNECHVQQNQRLPIEKYPLLITKSRNSYLPHLNTIFWNRSPNLSDLGWINLNETREFLWTWYFIKKSFFVCLWAHLNNCVKCSFMNTKCYENKFVCNCEKMKYSCSLLS